MQAAFLLLIVGLILVYCEFFVPGGVMGTIGAILLISSFFFFSSATDSWILITLFIMTEVTLVILMIRFALKVIQSSESDNSLYLKTDQAEFKRPHVPLPEIDEQGTALTDLYPSGYILVNDKKYPASSKHGYIDKGDSIKVIERKNSFVYVKLQDKT